MKTERNNRPWTDAETRSFCALFRNTSSQALATTFGRTEACIRKKASRMGLKKTKKYLAGHRKKS